MDNAFVHNALDSFNLLIDLCKLHGVRLLFLPAYSPELNPCELVFNIMKKYLRYHRQTDVPLWLEVIQALAQVDHAKVQQFYYSCLLLENIVKKSTHMRK